HPTVAENLAVYARVYEVPRADRDARMLQMMRLADLVGRERQLAGQLSGGYRQRLALSCALVHRPRLIFLDEPTAGVDPVSRRTFWAVIRRLADEGTTIVVTTHYMDEAELCDTLGFIYQGRLIAQEAPRASRPKRAGGRSSRSPPRICARRPTRSRTGTRSRRSCGSARDSGSSWPTGRAPTTCARSSSTRASRSTGCTRSSRRWRTCSSRSWTRNGSCGCG